MSSALSPDAPAFVPKNRDDVDEASALSKRGKRRTRNRNRKISSSAEDPGGHPPEADGPSAEVPKKSRKKPPKQPPAGGNQLKTQSKKGRRRAANRAAADAGVANGSKDSNKGKSKKTSRSSTEADGSAPQNGVKGNDKSRRSGPKPRRRGGPAAGGGGGGLKGASTGGFNSASGGSGYSRKRQGRLETKFGPSGGPMDAIARRAQAQNGPQHEAPESEIRRPSVSSEAGAAARRKVRRRERIKNMRQRLVMKQPVSDLVRGHAGQAVDVIQSLCSNKYECLVCAERVDPRQSVWNCGRCAIILHLTCATDWARTNMGQDLDQEAQEHAARRALLDPQNLGRAIELNISQGAFRTATGGRLTQDRSGLALPLREAAESKSDPDPVDSVQVSRTWRCPNCVLEIEGGAPTLYHCFCGKAMDPSYNAFITPHSCGDSCGRMRPNGCPHPCSMLCHPGACPPCTADGGLYSCPCGKTRFRRRCGEDLTDRTCPQVCDKELNCGKHRCAEKCHTGPCPDCPETLKLDCHCGHETQQERRCGTFQEHPEDPRASKYSCGVTCGRPLACGHHTCTSPCHPGACAACPRAPSDPQPCACGKKSLPVVEEEDVLKKTDTALLLKAGVVARRRRGCLDELPNCSGVCGKKLPCGIHRCRQRCHGSQTPCSSTASPQTPQKVAPEQEEKSVCQALVETKCRCGHRNVSVPCEDFSLRVRELLAEEHLTEADRTVLLRPPSLQEPHPAATCTRKCGLHLSCRLHRCKQLCCSLARAQHRCLDVCGKPLACGEHTCDRFCHSGPCGKCEVSFPDGQTCHCGKTHTPGPLLCGDDRIPCPNPCAKRLVKPRPNRHQSVSSAAAPRGGYTRNFQDAEDVDPADDDDSAGDSSGREEDPEKDSRDAECGHACPDTCHLGPCPRCTVLVRRTCSGGHRKRVLVPCQQRSGISCGEVCGRILPCGGHRCQQTCHSGPCPAVRPAPASRLGSRLQLLGVSTAALQLSARSSPAAPRGSTVTPAGAAAAAAGPEEPVCREPCLLPRQDCEHSCGAPCHPEAPCPETRCTVKVESECPCGRRSERVPCFVARGVPEEDPSAPASTGEETRLQKKLQQRLAGRVECDERCAMQQRNERFSQALAQVYGRSQSPSDQGRGEERFVPYPQELLEEVEGLRLIPFLGKVEPVFQKFVQGPPEGKQNHFFPPMPKQQRWLLHQLASFYGVTAMSYDQEPKRNVTITITPSSVAPRVSLQEAVEEHVRNPRQTRAIPQSLTLPLFQLRLAPSRILNAVAQTGADSSEYRLSFLSNRRAILITTSPELAQESRRALRPLVRQGLLSFSENPSSADDQDTDSEEEEAARRRFESKQRTAAPPANRPQWVRDWGRPSSPATSGGGWRRGQETPPEEDRSDGGFAPSWTTRSWGRPQLPDEGPESPGPAAAATEGEGEVDSERVEESSNPWNVLRTD